MYCLVRYIEDDILHVVPTKRLQEIKKNELYLAPYKKMGFFEATPILYHDNRSHLEKRKKCFQKPPEQTIESELTTSFEDVRLTGTNNSEQTIESELSTSIEDVRLTETNNSEQTIDSELTTAIEPVRLTGTNNSERTIESELTTSFEDVRLTGTNNSEQTIESESTNSIDSVRLTGTNNLAQDEKPKKTHKQHSCMYCKKVIFQLPRHWFKVHSNEPEVRDIISLHQNNPTRREKIEKLRKKGDFEHNRQTDDGKKIVMRESTTENVQYLPCPTCLGFFSKTNLRHHKKRCSPKKGDRCLQGNALKLTKYIHDRASETLKNQIAPNMYHDEVSNHFLFDEILILYGNFLCIKYTESHLKSYIRAQLRLLGRFMMQAKLINPNITSCKDLMHPSHIDTVRSSIDRVAGLNLETGIYEHPTNARTLSTEFKKILEVVFSECDKTENDRLRKLTKAVSRRYNLELAPYINRICKLSENRYKRSKQANKLPEKDDIEEYFEYLLKNASIHKKNIEKKYALDDWSKLCQYLLVALIVFNRKRPGETQRIELEDFHKRERIGQKDFESLSETEKMQANKYERITFRGKLGNTTALLIDKKRILPGIQTMLKYRSKAGVHLENRFLFGCPSNKDMNKTYEAYRCHRQFLVESGIHSTSLTFTNLRKQFATEVARDGPSHEEELRISNYMSHGFNIHKKIYDQSTSLIDITRVSQHLESSAKPKSLKTSASVEENEKRIHNKKRKYVDEYLPDSTSEEELDPKLVERCLGKFQHRKSWTSSEKQVTRSYFKDELEKDEHIDINKIKKLRDEYKDVLKTRSVPMIKQWLEGEKVKKKKEEAGIQSIRQRYSTPERDLLEKSTERYSLEGTEPSLEELQLLIDENAIYSERSADSLLRKFRYLQRGKKDKST